MDGFYGNLNSLPRLRSLFFSLTLQSHWFFFCFVLFLFFTMTADHDNFILLTFREILVRNQRITFKTTRNFVPPPALIIC